MCNILEPYPREIESCELCGTFSHVSYLGTISVCDGCSDLLADKENIEASNQNDQQL